MRGLTIFNPAFLGANAEAGSGGSGGGEENPGTITFEPNGGSRALNAPLPDVTITWGDAPPGATQVKIIVEEGGGFTHDLWSVEYVSIDASPYVFNIPDELDAGNHIVRIGVAFLSPLTEPVYSELFTIV